MLDPQTIERMGAKAGEGPILVALSGGGDSVALLHMLKDHLGAARFHAAIVDHKLREGSAADARRAAEIAASLGVTAQILELSWKRGASKAHEAARRARYAALCSAARKLGARVIATGHTRDDQTETIFLRGSRGSGMRGLAAMRAFSPAPIWPEGRNLWLARPLLSARRTALREYLVQRDASWIEDPANTNTMHARVRARQKLAEIESQGLDPSGFAEIGDKIQPHVDKVDEEAAAIIVHAASFEDDVILLDRALWQEAGVGKHRALYALITAASGAERGPTGLQIETLLTALARADFTGATLGGAWLQPRGTTFVIRRDPGALTGRADGATPIPPLPLPPGEETIWDGRVALTATEPGWSVVFDGRTAQLQHGENHAPLAAASPHWLIKERVQHVLGTD